MKMWITRNKAGQGRAFKVEPRFDKRRDKWFAFKSPIGIDVDFGLYIGELFLEITFENSPQEVEIVLPKTHNKVWHDIDEEPIYENRVTPIIIDSNYGHISQEGHYYNQVQWKSHIEFQKHREFKWAYEKDLMNL